MKRILTIVAIATLSMGFGAISLAQDAGPTGGSVQAKQHDHMGGGGLKVIEKIQKDILAGLKISDDQQQKVDALNKSTENQLKSMHKANKGSTDKKAANEARKDLMKKYNDSIKGILTTDQYKTYHEQMKAKMKELRDQRKDKKGGDGKP